MLQDYLTRNIKDGETVLRIVRRYPLGFVFRIGVFGLIVLVDFFLLTFFLQHGAWGLAGFFLVLLVCGFFIVRAWYTWSLNVLIVTDQRVIDIDQRGFFSRTVSETTYRKIQDISYSVSGLLPTLFHYGTLSIQTAGTQSKIELDQIHHPELLQDLLTNTQEQQADEPGPAAIK